MYTPRSLAVFVCYSVAVLPGLLLLQQQCSEVILRKHKEVLVEKMCYLNMDM